MKLPMEQPTWKILVESEVTLSWKPGWKDTWWWNRSGTNAEISFVLMFRPINISKSALLHSGTWCQIWDKGF